MGSAFSARSKKGDEAYSSGSTYWVPASADRAGLCAVERAALDVFELHARKASFDRARSGAEWWTLAMERDGGSVAWHFDRDYSLEGDVNLSPHVATVTYLADGGAPTVVVPLVSPSDAEKPVAGAGGECFACRPVAGKHMSFDGRFLHAAPDGVYGEDASSAGDRVTLLVNVWLDWKPDDADVLPAAVRETLSAARLPALCRRSACALARLERAAASPTSTTTSAAVDRRNRSLRGSRRRPARERPLRTRAQVWPVQQRGRRASARALSGWASSRAQIAARSEKGHGDIERPGEHGRRTVRERG